MNAKFEQGASTTVSATDTRVRLWRLSSTVISWVVPGRSFSRNNLNCGVQGTHTSYDFLLCSQKIISDTHFHLLCCVWLAFVANHTQQRQRENRENQVVRSGFFFHSAIQTKSNGLKGELRPFWSHCTCYIEAYIANTPGYSALFRGCRSLVGLALYA